MVLRIGHRVPDFSLFDSAGDEKRLSEFIQKGALTLIFFPFAFSGVCDREVCTFRDSILTNPKRPGANIVGISMDSVFTLKVFAETYNLGFPLLSDFNKKVAKAFGVLQDPWIKFGYKEVAKRSVFIVDRKGVLRYRWISDDPSKEPPYDEIISTVNRLG